MGSMFPFITMKVLVIEDDLGVRESLRLTLEDEGFLVDLVDNGPEGVYRAREWVYDCIILDVMLPELDGWQVLSQIRRASVKTPVLMLTALHDLDHRVRGLNAGADDYLPKPFSERELLARLRAVHRRSTGHGEDVVALGAVEIDTVKCEVRLQGELIHLSPAQYRMVAYLARRAGKVIPRQELAEAIMTEDDAASSKVIDVQIHQIRRKLGRDFVQNRRGIGYIVPQEDS